MADHRTDIRLFTASERAEAEFRRNDRIYAGSNVLIAILTITGLLGLWVGFQTAFSTSVPLRDRFRFYDIDVLPLVTGLAVVTAIFLWARLKFIGEFIARDYFEWALVGFFILVPPFIDDITSQGWEDLSIRVIVRICDASARRDDGQLALDQCTGYSMPSDDIVLMDADPTSDPDAQPIPREVQEASLKQWDDLPRGNYTVWLLIAPLPGDPCDPDVLQTTTGFDDVATCITWDEREWVQMPLRVKSGSQTIQVAILDA